MSEYIIRFLVGGAVVSVFAMLGDVLRPKSFAGLFGAAPSVALATLGIAIYQHGAGVRRGAEPRDDGGRDCACHLQRLRLPASGARTHAHTSRHAALDRDLTGHGFRPVRPHRRTGVTAIRISPSALKQGRWYEYVVRFALGGAATVLTGLISSRYGAAVGGLLLALPAIFCASATRSRAMKSGVNGRLGSTADGEAKRPRHSMPTAPASACSACWPLPPCSGCWLRKA